MVTAICFGGVRHLRASLPHITPGPLAFMGFLTLAAATLCLLHFLIRAFAATKNTDGETSPWCWTWTLRGMLLALILFAASCATIGVAHQVPWLFKRKPWPHESRIVVFKNSQNCLNVITALRVSVSDSGLNYPGTLKELLTNGSLGEGYWDDLYFKSADGIRLPWAYLPELSDTNAGDLPLLYSTVPVTEHGDYILGLNDASVSAVSREELDEALRRYHAVMTERRASSAMSDR